MKTKKMSQRTQVAAQIQELLHPPRGRPRKFSDDIQSRAHEVLERVARENGLTLKLLVEKIVEKFSATRVTARGMTTDDNDAQLRAVELAVKLLERLGVIPQIPEPQPRPAGHVRMVQVDPDGTERWLEIG